MDKCPITPTERPDLYRLTTYVPNKGIPIHNWFPYLQGYSNQLVRNLISYLTVISNHTVMDPFCGIGTTNLTCKQSDIPSIGYDISPLAVFVSRVKLDDGYIPADIGEIVKSIQKTKIEKHDLPDHPIFRKGISPDRVNEILTIKDVIEDVTDPLVKDFLLLGLLSIIEEVSLVQKDGAHYRYRTKPKSDNAMKSFTSKVNAMLNDLRQSDLRSSHKTKWRIEIGDARQLNCASDSINYVITSPPYLNRDNYTAQHKLELFLLEFVRNMAEYRKLTKSTLQSHVEADPFDSDLPLELPELNDALNTIKSRPLSHPKVPQMIEGYFDDMNLVLKELSRVVKPGGRIAVVVGNCAWSGILIEVDILLSRIAASHGFHIDEIMVTRYKSNSAQQIKKYGRIKIRESIITATLGN